MNILSGLSNNNDEMFLEPKEDENATETPTYESGDTHQFNFISKRNDLDRLGFTVSWKMLMLDFKKKVLHTKQLILTIWI